MLSGILSYTINMKHKTFCRLPNIQYPTKTTSVKLAAYSHSATDSPKKESKNTPKKLVQPHNPRHRNPFSPRFRPS